MGTVGNGGNWVLRNGKRGKKITEQENLGRNKGNQDNYVYDSELSSYLEDGCWDVQWTRSSRAELRLCGQPVF